MDEITRNHSHNNIIMMPDGAGGGTTASGKQVSGGSVMTCVSANASGQAGKQSKGGV